MQLPEGVKVTAVQGEPGDAERTVWALDCDGADGLERAVLDQVCSPHAGKAVTTDDSLGQLATMSTIAGNYEIREPSRWTQLASQRAYLTEGVRGEDVLITHWLVGSGDALVSIRFERLAGAPIERGVLDAIEHMRLSCGPIATVAVEG
ncbi:hypothetical protein QLQ15_08395 [Lysobacter sp. LF1]|uniref:Uncharacterized protein n=1 Tax=Lysobacter stagni TaxID=3045172 RepID=A0ABT6XFK8_9GAMM|nr:hypothetical protein [Lysobacter sp. LF1]MDI9238933.1 hypothetical protein [Lysobacter sp. LF1]